MIKIFFFLLFFYKQKQYVIESDKLSNNAIVIYPYFHVKNDTNINIIFWDFYKENSLETLIKIKCKNKIKLVNRTKLGFYWDDIYFNLRYNFRTFNLIKFDTKKLYYKFSYNNIFNIDFKCDLKFLEIIYNGSKFTDTVITNIQIYDTNQEDMNLNFWRPFVFVNFREENINTKIFTNKFNIFHGGLNGKNDIKYSQIGSYYDKEVGVNWTMHHRNQFIELDDKVFYFFNKKIIKSFSFYLNFDIICKYLDKINYQRRDKTLVIYEIYSSGLILSIYIRLVNLTRGLFLFIGDNAVGFTIFNQLVDINSDNINPSFRKKQIDKNDIGLKFFIFRHFKNNDNRYFLGFKKNSNYLRNNNPFFEVNSTNLLRLNINDSSYSSLKHFIGKKQSTIISFSKDNYMTIYIILNEYGVFSGGEFDEIENIDNNLNIKLKGKYEILITNQFNLDRRFNLSNSNIISKCPTFKCILCDKNDICIYCYYNYYLNESNNCILNSKINKFVNEYSELIDVSENVNNNEFTSSTNQKIINSPYPKFSDFNLSDTIIYLYIKITSSDSTNYLNYSLNDPIKINYNIDFKENVKNVPLTIFLNNADTFNKYIFEMNDNNSFQINIKKNKFKIDCNNIDNEIFYKDIDCKSICSSNSINYYYWRINEKKGRCVKKIKNGYYSDNNNIILKCPNNCVNCSYNTTTKNIICNECIKGYKSINGFCFFDNNLDCNNKKDLNQVFDNNNFDGIKICEEYCNLCRDKEAENCSILNLNFNACSTENIKIKKPNLILIKKNFEKCEKIINNECKECKKYYYLNEINLCVDCIKNCEICDNSFTCNNCKIGFFLNEDNICKSCASIYENCLECSKDECSKFKEIILSIKCDINNCNKCNENNKCSICNNPYILKDNKCICDTKNEFFINKEKCLSCLSCSYCIRNSINICSNCLKCKNKFLFEFNQNKKEIDITYNKNIINIKENTQFIKISNLNSYIILFNENKIKITIFDEKILNSTIIIEKNIINTLKIGNFEDQTMKINDFFESTQKNVNITIQNNESHKINYKKYTFPKINIKNNLISESIKITTQSIDYSRFLIIFMPFIIFLNQTTLIILLNTDFSENFLDLLKILKKNNRALINNNKIMPFKEFEKSYNKIKIKFKENLVIGEMNLLDIDIIIVFSLWLSYIILVHIFDNYIKSVNKILIFIKNNLIFLKVFGFTFFQSYLIKNYYKIIFFTEVLFDLNSYKLKIYWFLFIQFYIFIILYFLNYNFFYCQLFANPFFNLKLKYYDYKMIRLFVFFKKKETRNFNILMNICDFFIVLFFMELNNNFIIQILIIKLLVLLKLIYVIKLYTKYKKNKIFTQIISFILLLNFYLLLFFNHFSKIINEISYIQIFFFLIINIWEITRIFIYHLLKILKKIKKNKLLKIKKYYNNLFKNQKINNFKMNLKKKKFK